MNNDEFERDYGHLFDNADGIRECIEIFNRVAHSRERLAELKTTLKFFEGYILERDRYERGQ